MKTWLTIDKPPVGNPNVYRHNEYGDEPEWIGTIEGGHGVKWFYAYGDNRSYTVAELKQILDFCR